MAVVLTGGAPLAAAESTVKLSYDAAADCPSRQDFLTAVESRGGQFDAEYRGEVPRVFSVAIRKDAGGYLGSVQVKRQASFSAPREVHGTTCSEVVDALAVVTAIELRPASDDTRATSRTDEPKPPAPGKVTVPQQNAVGFRGKSTWGPEELTVTAGTLRFRPLFSLTLSGGAEYGPIPKTILSRYDLVFRFANFLTTPDGAQRLNGPILRARVGVIGVPAASHDTSNTSTRIGDGAGLGLGACWSPHFDSHGWVILGCAEFGYSVLSLTTKEADGRASPFETVGFGAGGPLFEVEYNLTSHLQVGARAGGDFVAGFFGARRADGTKVFSSNPWAVYGSLGVGVHF